MQSITPLWVYVVPANGWMEANASFAAWALDVGWIVMLADKRTDLPNMKATDAKGSN